MEQLTNTRRWLRFGIALLALSCSVGLAGQDLAEQTGSAEFLRFQDAEAQWQGRLQTAIVSYEDAEGIEVDLVAAIHIADPDYYAGLNDYFRARDAVLYELVAEPEQRPVPGQALPSSPLSFLQRALAAFLQVRFQLQLIDYSPANFRHADLSPAELQTLMAANNETFVSLFLKLATTQMQNQRQGDESAEAPALNATTLLQALSAEDSGQALKYLLARELGRGGGLLVPAEMEDEISLLGHRNRVALEVLSRTLDEGARRVSIFYGAAHMPGLERALLGELGFRRTGTRWLDAWTVP